jgi:hypothetical protein
MDDEKQIQEWFQEQRREDEQSAPPFDKTWRAALVRRRVRRSSFIFGKPALAAAAVFLGAAALLLWSGRVRNNQHHFDAAADQVDAIALARITQWRSPTNFLLRTPGHEFLTNVPEIGRTPFNLQAPPLADDN